VLGAHYDHLGTGLLGASLAGRDEAGRPIHFGADDNASGAAAVLTMMEMLAGAPAFRDVVAAFWSAEEIGLVGSTQFVNAAPVPIDQIAAYLNFDMVGRMQRQPARRAGDRDERRVAIDSRAGQRRRGVRSRRSRPIPISRPT
jgi:Zn-dependent M28 family amino/carboxypeptidase